MVRKITLSVPDELHAKIEKWKEEFNFSKYFQDAIASAIEKKENFLKRLDMEDETMEQIISRLKKEKSVWKQDLTDEGMKAGYEWARAASYEELLHVTDENYDIRHPSNEDDTLVDYLADVLEDHYYLQQDKNLDVWLKGWIFAVQEFWKKVENKLDNN